MEHDFPAEALAAVRRFAERLTNDPHQADDLAQDVFVRVWSRWWSRPREPRALRVYCFRAAVRRWQDLRRRRVALPLVAEPIDPQAEASAGLAQQEELAMALAWLQRLPEQQRLAVHLVAVEELSLAEAAVALGSTPNAVKANLSLARAKLRSWAEVADG